MPVVSTKQTTTLSGRLLPNLSALLFEVLYIAFI